MPVVVFALLIAGTHVAKAKEPRVELQPEMAIWGEPITLTAAVANPLAVQRAGGITVSFSSPVLVLNADAKTTLYYPGDLVYQQRERRNGLARDVMTEAWYPSWQGGDSQHAACCFCSPGHRCPAHPDPGGMDSVAEGPRCAQSAA